MPKITPDITNEAKQVYDNLPETVHKGKWVSEAIIEKSERNNKLLTEQRVRDICQEEIRRAKDE